MQYRARMALTALVVVIGTADVLHTMLECGRFPGLFSGFATKQQLDDTLALFTEFLDDQQKREIRVDTVALCQADKAHDESAATAAYNDRADVLTDWRARKNFSFPVPSCADLGY